MLYMPPQAAGPDNIMPEVEAITTLAADELCPLARRRTVQPFVHFEMSVRALFVFHADALVALLQQMSSLYDAKNPFQFDALPHPVVLWSCWLTSRG